MSNKPWFLYLIECQDGSIYTGITVDVAARYAAHEQGEGARYTRSHPPKSLLAVVEYPDRSTASKAEYEIKQLSASEKREFAGHSKGACCSCGNEIKPRSELTRISRTS